MGEVYSGLSLLSEHEGWESERGGSSSLTRERPVIHNYVL